eukprot:3311315-Amphidinium_carterae.1
MSANNMSRHRRHRRHRHLAVRQRQGQTLGIATSRACSTWKLLVGGNISNSIPFPPKSSTTT